MATARHPLLSIDDLVVTIGVDRPLVTIDSLEIAEGATVLIEGESGSGKSTLLRIIAGLIAPSGGDVLWSGNIAVLGTELSSQSITTYRSNLFWLAQKPQLEDGPVDESFRIVREQNRATESDRSHGYSVEQLMDALGLAPAILPQDSRTISGGEAARVAIIRMLSLGRPLLLLDEPTAALDSDRSDRILPMIRSLVSKSTTIIVASHDTTIRPYFDTIFRIEKSTLQSVNGTVQ